MNRVRPNGRTILRRHAGATVITAAVAVGLLDPYACRQYSLAGASAEAAAPTRAISKSERARLLGAARRALALVPAPRGYALDRESVRSEADGAAAWSAGRGAWAAPGAARAERIYEPPGDGGENAPPVLEQRVYVNSAVEVPSGLASVGGTPRLFPLPGASAIEVTTIGAEDPEPAPSEGGRIAMPVTPDQAASAITILRIVFADPKTERIYRSAAAGSVEPVDTRAKRAGEVQTLVVELYGGKRDVEALARRLPVAALRRLLDPR